MWQIVTLFLLFAAVGPVAASVKLSSPSVIITGNATVLSENRTFEMGFFSTNGGSNWYLGVWYASLPAPTYVWVANRQIPVRNLMSAALELAVDGRLKVRDESDMQIWETDNAERATEVALLDTGNLVLRSAEGKVVWQSFDFPADTWLPGMNITRWNSITSWRSSSDPSPGLYSLRLKSPAYGEFELVFNGTESYWSTGNWTGEIFAGVPQMMVRYIYKFRFVDPFKPTASFWYTETPLEAGVRPPLSRFQVDSSGQLRQYTYSPQTENWNMFWSQPENLCRVYGLCGKLGFCNGVNLLKPCQCIAGFRPENNLDWDSGYFSGGCRRNSDSVCSKSDTFEEVGAVTFDGAVTVSFSGSRSFCEGSCLNNCSCIGLYHNQRTNLCKNVHGTILNLRNLTSDSTNDDVLFVRVDRGDITKKKNKTVLITVSVAGSVTILGVLFLSIMLLQKRKRWRKKEEEESVFPVTNLKVFSHKELNSATRGFSEKLGHGGFGAVFRGELADNSIVAVKRLERPGGGGEKEFRAEVCTIGNIQHVNLVRLRGFCSENFHRLLVYDYMENGPMSSYLRSDGPNLRWDIRFRAAIGTARGIAYLHEECRDCIIHCDIKPENILLDAEFSAKVSDFGLAKLIGRDFSRVLATMRGTWGYVAPEWISGVAITAKADVYSYGMTLLELIGGRRNVVAPPPSGGGGGGAEKWFFPPWAARKILEGNVGEVLDQRLGNQYDVAEAERVGFVAVWCIQDDEVDRPTMGMVVKMLEGVVEVAVPPLPKLLEALVSGESFRGVEAHSQQGVSIGVASSVCDIHLSGKSQSSNQSVLAGEEFESGMNRFAQNSPGIPSERAR